MVDNSAQGPPDLFPTNITLIPHKSSNPRVCKRTDFDVDWHIMYTALFNAL